MRIDWHLARDAQLLCDTTQAASHGSTTPSWPAALGRLFGPHEMIPGRNEMPGGQIQTIQRGLMQISKISMTPATLNRRREDIARKDSGFDIYQNILLLGMSGQAEVRSTEGARTAEFASIGPGDYIIFSQWLPYKIEASKNFEAIVILMPGWWLGQRQPPRGVMQYGLKVSAASAIAPIFEAAFNVLLAQSNNDVNGQAAVELFGDILTYSMNVAFLLHSKQKISDGRGPRVLSYILLNCSDDAISPQAAAADLKCSLSTVHKSCAAFGTTFNQLVINLRLSMACHLLWLGHSNISQIAFDVGFKEVSHFNHTFKKKFGVSPSAFQTRLK